MSSVDPEISIQKPYQPLIKTDFFDDAFMDIIILQHVAMYQIDE